MITDEQYTQHVLARASSQWHGEKIDFDDLQYVLKEFIAWGNALDSVKKSLMYGRDFQGVEGTSLPIDNITPPIPEHYQPIAHAILGVATEGVELIEALYSYLFEKKDLDWFNLQEEFGDVAWYRALGLHCVNQTHAQNIAQNDAKLEKRFGPIKEGFTYKAVNERDLEGERAVLEGNVTILGKDEDEDRSV